MLNSKSSMVATSVLSGLTLLASSANDSEARQRCVSLDKVVQDLGEYGAQPVASGKVADNKYLVLTNNFQTETDSFGHSLAGSWTLSSVFIAKVNGQEEWRSCLLVRGSDLELMDLENHDGSIPVLFGNKPVLMAQGLGVERSDAPKQSLIQIWGKNISHANQPDTNQVDGMVSKQKLGAMSQQFYITITGTNPENPKNVRRVSPGTDWQWRMPA